MLTGFCGTFTCTHPAASAPAWSGAQTSAPVHQAPSSQAALLVVCDARPPEHVSIVHAIPSSGTFVLSFVATHPAPRSQISSVHALPSSHTRRLPPAQTPAWQAWPTMQSDV